MKTKEEVKKLLEGLSDVVLDTSSVLVKHDCQQLTPATQLFVKQADDAMTAACRAYETIAEFYKIEDEEETEDGETD